MIERGREHPYVGKVFRDGLTAIRDEILARDPASLPERPATIATSAGTS